MQFLKINHNSCTQTNLDYLEHTAYCFYKLVYVRTLQKEKYKCIIRLWHNSEFNRQATCCWEQKHGGARAILRLQAHGESLSNASYRLTLNWMRARTDKIKRNSVPPLQPPTSLKPNKLPHEVVNTVYHVHVRTMAVNLKTLTKIVCLKKLLPNKKGKHFSTYARYEYVL